MANFGDATDAVPEYPSDCVAAKQPVSVSTPVPVSTQDAVTSGDSGFADDEAISSIVSEHSDETYRMDREKRGQLILINNTKFQSHLDLRDRQGTEKDIESIRRVFGGMLGFEVKLFEDQLACKMIQCISTAARNAENQKANCFAVVILTHGSDGGKVFGIDEDVLISKLMDPVRHSEYLVGKPKMVFVQACRGKSHDKGHHLSDNGGSKNQQMLIPIEADFLYVYSTADGHVSFQSPRRGSWFVQALCKELETNWDKKDMMQMLTRVCHALAYGFASHTPSNKTTHELKQVSSVTTTLTKAIHFNKK